MAVSVNWGILFAGVLVIGALPLGVYVRALIFGDSQIYIYMYIDIYIYIYIYIRNPK